MRLGHIEFRVGRFYILDPMQGEHEMLEYMKTDPEGFQEECEVIAMLGEAVSMKTKERIPYNDWHLGRAKAPVQTDACHCMVFVLMYMYYIHETGSLPPMDAFDSTDMGKIRVFIAWIVILGAKIPRLENTQYVGLAIAHRENVRKNSPKEQLEDGKYRIGNGEEQKKEKRETKEQGKRKGKEEGHREDTGEVKDGKVRSSGNE